MQALEKLKNLSLAGNAIENIKGSLDNLNNLNELNISGNKISTFKEALHLNRLPNLQVLAFYDPHFGENPICNLCNYQVLFFLFIQKPKNTHKLDIHSIQFAENHQIGHLDNF